MSYYMNMSSFNEGERAEAYKKKKISDEREEFNKNFNRALHRTGSGDKFGDKNKTKTSDDENDKRMGEDFDRYMRSNDMVKKHNIYMYDTDGLNAIDATNRHIRRHPKQYQECGIFSEVTFLNEVSISPIKSFIKKLELIKKASPNEYDGPDDIKKFINQNYNDIIKASEILEEEPKKINKQALTYLASVAVTFIAGIIIPPLTPIKVGVLIRLSSSGLIFISSIVYTIIASIRATHDQNALNELMKIRSALKKIDKNKLSESDSKKVSDMLRAIDNTNCNEE